MENLSLNWADHMYKNSKYITIEDARFIHNLYFDYLSVNFNNPELKHAEQRQLSSEKSKELEKEAVKFKEAGKINPFFIHPLRHKNELYQYHIVNGSAMAKYIYEATQIVELFLPMKYKILFI